MTTITETVDPYGLLAGLLAEIDCDAIAATVNDERIETPIVEPAEPTEHDNDNAPASLPQPSTTTKTRAKAKASFPQKRRRRSQSHDQKAVAVTRHYGLSIAPVSSGAFSSNPPTSSHPFLTSTSSTLRDHTPANDNDASLRIWENTTDYAKMIYGNRALADCGTPYDFTLNFGPKVAKAALRAKKGARPFIADRLQKALKKIGRDDAFWFVLDVTPSGRVHVHGGIALDPSQEGAARAILHKVAGKWGSKHHRERQVDLDQQTDVDGWIDRYCFRKVARSRNLIGETPLYIARPLRQIAKANYGRDRSIINEQRRSPSSSSPSPASSSSSAS